MEVKAHAKFLRMSPRKARLVSSIVRGDKALDAITKLELMPQKAAREVSKLLNSALANAQHNFGLSKNNLIIKEIQANVGPTFKRYKPRARGGADTIKRRMTHLTVVLASLEGEGKKISETSKVSPKEQKREPVKTKAGVKSSVEKAPISATQPSEDKAEKEEKVSEKPAKKEIKNMKEKPIHHAIKEVKEQVKPGEKNQKIKKTKEGIKRIKEEEKVQKEKFAKKESFFGGLKRFFRRKGF